MKGSEFVKTLPKSAGEQRERMIFDAVRRRNISPIVWDRVETQDGDLRAKFWVSRDALRVGDALDSVRVTVNHETAQHIADELDAVLPTQKLSDEIWKQATVRVPSMPHSSWVNDRTMGDTRRMVEQHNLIEKQVFDQHVAGKRGLIADVGKDWVNTVQNWMPPPPTTATCPDVGPIRSANYGWHGGGSRTAATPAGGNLWQPLGRCHTMSHTDYSQMVRLVQREVIVCDPSLPLLPLLHCKVMDIADVAADSKYAKLVSNEGVMQDMRHPAVLRSCEPDVRCPRTIKSGMRLMSLSCPLNCVDLPPVSPDPTGGIPTHGSVEAPAQAAVSGGNYLALFAAAAFAFGGAYWIVTRS